ncbi:hypothetical protein MTR67_050776 [Solanum verrucosum]|uniref:Uncharacterized protein n=1 Tax=Solanum verrucosum TaxID=315347 RepID=A0AAF0ZZI6_SOLVR|nr:hypothetical protein MTR67_050776 [Solanum verrucosum]
MTGVTSAPWRESLRTPPRSSSLFSSVFVLSGGTHTSNLLSLILLIDVLVLDCESIFWGSASLINLDLSHPFLAYSIQAFNNLRLRLGSSLQNRIIYDVGNLELPCHLFTKQGDELFGFSNGCLRMDKWDELYRFFNKTGALVTFSLNALRGRQRTSKRVWEGNWDSSNAHDFIDYTVSKGYQIHSWEFGNELSGKGIGAKVDAEQYGEYVIHLNNLIDQLYKHFQPRPLLLALGGFYDKELFEMFLEMSGPGTVDALTHHIYNLGPDIISIYFHSKKFLSQEEEALDRISLIYMEESSDSLFGLREDADFPLVRMTDVLFAERMKNTIRECSSISKKLFADQAEAVGIKHKTVSSRAEGDKKGNHIFDKENEERMFDEKVDDEMSPSYGYSERDSSAESFYVDEVLASK